VEKSLHNLELVVELKLAFVHSLAERTDDFEVADLLNDILIGVVLKGHCFNQIEPPRQLLSLRNSFRHILIDTLCRLDHGASIIMEVIRTLIQMAKDFLRKFSL